MSGLRIHRRRAFARVLRRILRPSAPPDAPEIRLRELAAERGVAARDSDAAELLARVALEDMIPPEIVLALGVALHSVLIHIDPPRP